MSQLNGIVFIYIKANAILMNELFEEFTETSVVKPSVNQQQMFNKCSVTIVYEKD
jgi:hypothetical protein